MDSLFIETIVEPERRAEIRKKESELKRLEDDVAQAAIELEHLKVTAQLKQQRINELKIELGIESPTHETIMDTAFDNDDKRRVTNLIGDRRKAFMEWKREHDAMLDAEK